VSFGAHKYTHCEAPTLVKSFGGSFFISLLDDEWVRGILSLYFCFLLWELLKAVPWHSCCGVEVLQINWCVSCHHHFSVRVIPSVANGVMGVLSLIVIQTSSVERSPSPSPSTFASCSLVCYRAVELFRPCEAKKPCYSLLGKLIFVACCGFLLQKLHITPSLNDQFCCSESPTCHLFIPYGIPIHVYHLCSASLVYLEEGKIEATDVSIA
jgi:hypothetical protein